MKKFKFDSTEIGVVVLCIALVVLWAPISNKLFPKKEQAAISEIVNKTTSEKIQEPKKEEAKNVVEDVPDTKDEVKIIGSKIEQFKISDSATASLIVSNDKSGLTKIVLDKFNDSVENNNDKVTMIKDGNQTFAGIVNNTTGIVSFTKDKNKLIAKHAVDASGIFLTEEWSPIKGEEYAFNYKIIIENESQVVKSIPKIAVGLGEVNSPKSSGMFSSNADIAEIDAFITSKNKNRSFSHSKISKGKGVGEIDESYKWLALHSKYFITYLEAKTVDFASFTSKELERLESKEKFITAEAIIDVNKHLAPGETIVLEYKAYVGPKDYDEMKKLGDKTVGVLRMDLFFFFNPAWMGWLSRQILVLLIYIHGLFPYTWSYGLAIILITLTIKMLFWPLTHHSTASMHRMQQLQPLMKELQEKYKDNKELLNTKMMALYKEYKVNPFSGCLPILLQMPVFFALFNTLRTSIELRHAEFFWVKDLAMPDVVATIPLGFFDLPICPLAIAMGITMVGQQMMMPTVGDPKQAKMMKMMTFVFVFLLYNMPSGLTLYWTINQLLSMIQSYITNKKVKEVK